jgi:DNA helicase II / ATP-dependent DNA helicase PcrA
VFEDEAQDSSPLQTRLLTLLAANPTIPTGEPNLVRVGDPNQAINSTFTPADPVFFNQFCDACRRQDRLVTMDQAGRSTGAIMDRRQPPAGLGQPGPGGGARDPLSGPGHPPVPPDDPQPNANPEALGAGVEITRRPPF